MLRLPPPGRQSTRAATRLTARPASADPEHPAGADLGGSRQPAPRLDEDPDRERHQRGPVGERGEDLGPGEAEAPPERGRPPCQPRRPEGKAQRAGVGGHVHRIGEERQRAGDQPAGDLHAGEREHEHERSRERRPLGLSAVRRASDRDGCAGGSLLRELDPVDRDRGRRAVAARPARRARSGRRRPARRRPDRRPCACRRATSTRPP